MGGRIAPDCICLDAEGCIWASTAHDAKDCARVREDGEVLERIQLDRFCFASMLGGPDRRTLFMLAADWRGSEKSTTSSLRGRARSSSPTRRHPESAGRERTA
jgi:sugar lactone lactonase YvrE